MTSQIGERVRLETLLCVQRTHIGGTLPQRQTKSCSHEKAPLFKLALHYLWLQCRLIVIYGSTELAAKPLGGTRHCRSNFQHFSSMLYILHAVWQASMSDY